LLLPYSFPKPALLGQPATVPDGVRFIEGIGVRGGVRVDHTEGNWTSHYLLVPKTPAELMLCETLRALKKDTAAVTGKVEAENLLLKAAAAKREQDIASLKEELARAKKKIFGTSSEKSTAQPPEPEPEFDESASSQQAEEAAGAAKKPRTSNGGRKPIPDHLPRERVEHILQPEDQICPCCQGAVHFIGEEVTEQVTRIPASYVVLQHARAKYVCRKCNKNITAPGVKQMIPKSNYASPEFLAHVAVSKFQYGLPFYRQEKIFEQDHLPVSRTTLANLIIGCSNSLDSLFELLREHLCTQDVVHADETTVQVLKEDEDRRPQSKSYMWAYRSREDAVHPVVLFDYQMTRAGKHPKKFLRIGEQGAFSGYLQTDGYAGYNGMTGVIRVGCMTHARRKFDEAVATLPKGVKWSPAHVAIDLIGKLYEIESRIKGLDHRSRYRIREQESVPILQGFKDWLDKSYSTVVPQTPLGRAIGYALDQWAAISRYVEDGRLAIDNNLSEREIKMVVIGRKNWMFADSMDGMRANATMYSLVATAKANGLNPYEYLRHVFVTLPYLKTAAEAESLLPWNLPQLRCTH
jgi:transposase